MNNDKSICFLRFSDLKKVIPLFPPVPSVPKEQPDKRETCLLKMHKTNHYITLEPSENVTCKSVEPVDITSCQGNCKSSAIATYGSNRYTPDCKCCKPFITEERKINLTCSDNLPRETTFSVITECRCNTFSCVAGPSHADEIAVNKDSKQVVTKDKRKRRRRALSRLFALSPWKSHSEFNQENWEWID